MAKITNFLLVSLIVFLISCRSEPQNVISQQKVGDKVVVLISNEGSITKGAGSFYIEFHEAADNAYYDVGKIDAEAKMQMAGTPMNGELKTVKTEIPGRYEIKYNFPMSGSWVLVVFFGGLTKVQFELNVI